MKFYKCPICGNIITLVSGNENLIKCCGVSMDELIPNVENASKEKHIPVYNVDENFINIKVGEVEHPMTEEHHIVFVAQVFGNNIRIFKLSDLLKPEIKFEYIKGSKLFAYCNIHGLWMNDVK